MGLKVVELIKGKLIKSNQSGELPSNGMLAGQSVLSALLELYRAEPHFTGPFNDIDIFHTRTDRLLENGHFDDAHEEETAWLHERQLSSSDYDHIFEQRFNIGTVMTRGKLNLIEMTPSAVLGFNPKGMGTHQRLDVVLSEFDLTPVQVGVCLETGELRWTRGFEEFAQGAPAQAAHIGLAERTWLRVDKKRQAMPWMAWDDEQIRSAVHLAQIRNAMTVHRSKKCGKLLESWAIRYDAQLDAFDETAGLHKAIEQGTEFKPQTPLVPIWKWEWREHLIDFIGHMGDRRKAGLLPMNESDTLLARTMVNLVSSHINQYGGLLVKVTSENQASVDHGLMSDPMAMMVQLACSKTSEQFMALRPETLFDEGLGKAAPLRHELLGMALGAEKLEIAHGMLDLGMSPNAREHGPLGPTIYQRALMQARPNVQVFALGEPETEVEPSKTADHRSLKHKEPLDHRALAFNELLAKMRDCGANLRLPVGNGSTVAHEVMGHVNLGYLAHQLPKHDPQQWRVRDARGHLPGHQLSASNENVKRLAYIGSEIRLDRDDERRLALRDALRTAMSANKVVHEKNTDATIDLPNADLVRLALENGANPNELVDEGTPAVIKAVHHNDIETVKHLLSHGASLNTADHTGITPLMVAAREGHEQMVSLLIDSGADVNATCSKDYTPLIYSIFKSNTAIARTLIEAGANTRHIVMPSGLHLLQMAMLCSDPGLPVSIIRTLDPVEADRLTPSALAYAEKMNMGQNCAAALQAETARRAIDRMMSTPQAICSSRESFAEHSRLIDPPKGTRKQLGVRP